MHNFLDSANNRFASSSAGPIGQSPRQNSGVILLYWKSGYDEFKMYRHKLREQ